MDTTKLNIKHISKIRVIEKEQVDVIKTHLDLVFKHEIDPSMGDENHQNLLNQIHNKPKSSHNPNEQLPRC